LWGGGGGGGGGCVDKNLGVSLTKVTSFEVSGENNRKCRAAKRARTEEIQGAPFHRNLESFRKGEQGRGQFANRKCKGGVRRCALMHQK